MPAPAVVWRPDADLLEHSNVARFMAAEGIATFPDLVARSIDEPEWFWDAVVRFLDIRFSEPYDQVLDVSDGIPWAKWFTGGRCNIAVTCLDRHADDPEIRDRAAIVWEGEEGDVRTLTWSELRTLTDRMAAGFAARGVKCGRRGRARSFRWCRRRWPRCSRSPSSARCFSRSSPVTAPTRSRSASRMRVRSRSSPPTGSRGAARPSPMKETADAAVAQVATVHTVVVVPRLGRTDLPMTPGRDLTLDRAHPRSA